MTIVTVNCHQCGTIIHKTLGQYRTKIKRSGNDHFFCSRKCVSLNNTTKKKCSCDQCGIDFHKVPSEIGKNNFCSYSCSAKYSSIKRGKMSSEQKETISKSLKSYFKTGIKKKSPPKYKNIVWVRIVVKTPEVKTQYFKKCEICGELFEVKSKCFMAIRKVCSYHCSGVKAASCRVLRSKNEIHFAELCEQYFDKVLCNEIMFNGWDADVIIEDIKTAVMWNGRWHYVDGLGKNHSLKQVQNRDCIKIKEIKNAGYVPYVIKDMGRKDDGFVIKQFEKFLKTCTGC